MRSLALLATAALVLASDVAATDAISTFNAWALTHGKVYTKEEHTRRFAIFKENSAAIDKLNQRNSRAHFVATQFADLTDEEFKALYTSKLDAPTRANIAVIGDSVKGSADYRGYLPPIKNQGMCKSSWAFSAVANMEGQTFLKTGKVVSLSEQQLVSCDKSSSGCDGGLMSNAFNYTLEHGIASEEAYPYKSSFGVAHKCKKKFAPVANFTSVENWGTVESDEQLIKYLDKYGPLSVAIEGGNPIMKYYGGGIISDPTDCSGTLDLGVTLVGYGTEVMAASYDYWRVRVSWGSMWGEEGYLRMARGKNMCGVNSAISSIVA